MPREFKVPSRHRKPLFQALGEIATAHPGVRVRHHMFEGEPEGPMTIEEFAASMETDYEMDPSLREWADGRNFGWGYTDLGFVRLMAIDPVTDEHWVMLREVEEEGMPVGRPVPEMGSTRNGRRGKPTKREPEKLPFIEISDGTLICRHCGPGSPLRYQANKSGAKSLGKELAERKFGQWLYSSSIDFPDEYGAPDIDFRSLIEGAAGLDIPEDRPW